MQNRGYAKLVSVTPELSGMLETEGVQGMSEYRLHITVPRLPFRHEHRWEPLIEHLERCYEGLGPIIAWHDEETAWVVVATEAESEAAAVKAGVDAVVDSLVAADLGHLYPSAVDAEAIDRALEPA